MSSHIRPDSVNLYLSGIANELEEQFPEVRKNRNSRLVTRTMRGCLRRWGKPHKRKSPLTHEDMELVLKILPNNPMHDDYLFAAMLVTGFHALLRVGELTFPSAKKLQNYRKVTLRHTVDISIPNQYSFTLPSHKTDRYFDGNNIIIQATNHSTNPDPVFRSYLSSRDTKFPLRPELWIRENGELPTREWFTRKLRQFFPSESNLSGHSMRAGDATSLALSGLTPDEIKQMGRWSSEAWEAYLRKNSFLFHALLSKSRI
jgi:hypothetical protein